MGLTADRKRILGDFKEFSVEALEVPLHAQPHDEMCAFIADSSQVAKLQLVPRDCWKTSINSTAYPLFECLRAWFLFENPNFRTMVDSETTRLSQYVINAIARYVQNGFKFHKYFGDLYAKELHREGGLSLKFGPKKSGNIKEPNFLASGIGSSKTGLHFDLISLDDLVTKENFDTVAKREKVWLHYRMMYSILEASHGEQTTLLHVIGTRYHDDDIYGRIIKEEEKSIAEGEKPFWSMMIRPAVDDNGVLFFPDVLNEKELAKRKSKQQGMFWAQYMNDPNKENAPFKREQLKWKSHADFPELTKIRLTVDAAIKEEQIAHGDYNAMAVGGWDKWAKPWFYDVDIRRDLTTPDFIDRVLDMAQRWQVEQIIIESKQESALADLFRMEMFRRRQYFPIFYVKTHMMQVGKLARWKRLQPFAERGGITFAQEIPEATKLEIIDQWSRAPFAQYDDIMDAIEMHLTHMPLIGEDGEEEPAQGELPARTAEEVLEGVKKYQDGAPILENVFPHLKRQRLLIAQEEGGEEVDPGLCADDRDLMTLEQGIPWQ